MNTQSLNGLLSYMNAHPWITLLIIVWISFWKLLALWKATKHNHLTIFIVLGILNTAGIAEIIYIIYLYFKDKKKIIK